MESAICSITIKASLSARSRFVVGQAKKRVSGFSSSAAVADEPASPHVRFKSPGIRVEQGIGTDFSPVLIEAAQRDGKNFLGPEQLQRLEFHQAKNESLLADLSAALKKVRSQLQGSFDFIFGVNTIRYCHDAGNELDCVRDIFDLLAPGGVCVVIDMNNRFPLFRSDLKNRLRRIREEECYVASLEDTLNPLSRPASKWREKSIFAGCLIPPAKFFVVLCVCCRLF
jgi:SAM-dependent methyltransferase